MPETYIPVLRNGRNERKVIKEFTQSSLPGTTSRSLQLAPLVEVTNEGDVEELGPFEEAGVFVMVELPRYLTERANRYAEPVTRLIGRNGGVEAFYQNHSTNIDIPVVSGSIDPVDYSEYQPAYEALESEFDKIALRLFLRDYADSLTGDQKGTLENLGESVRNDDIVLFDLYDTRVNETVVDDLSYLADLFEANQKAVLNAFDAYNDYPDNQSPHIADDIGASAFGDFGINQRFKPRDGGPPAKVYHRHYLPNESTVEFFEGDSYEGAAAELTDWSEWDRSHCDGCRRADRTTNFDANTWSQIKMQHYFSSVIQGEI